MKWIGIAAAAAGLALLGRKKGTPDMPTDIQKPGEGTPQLALIAGDP